MFPWRIGLGRDVRAAAAGSGRLARPWRWRGRVCVLTAAVAVVVGVSALPASAGTSASVTATVKVLVRSITVSPQAIKLDTCETSSSASTGSSLGFPNGECYTASAGNQVKITNGPVADHIDVQGSNATPADGGTNWTLCVPTGAACTGSAGAPGEDQFIVQTRTSSLAAVGPELTGSPQCDGAFTGTAGDCSAAAGASSTEALFLTGPSSSTDNSSSFHTVVTWTAEP